MGRRRHCIISSSSSDDSDFDTQNPNPNSQQHPNNFESLTLNPINNSLNLNISHNSSLKTPHLHLFGSQNPNIPDISLKSPDLQIFDSDKANNSNNTNFQSPNILQKASNNFQISQNVNVSHLQIFNSQNQNPNFQFFGSQNPNNAQTPIFSQNPNIFETPSNSQNPNNFENLRTNPIIIEEDDEFIDVSDNLCSQSPMNSGSTCSSYFEPSECPISLFLSNLGLKVKNDWIRALENSVLGFRDLDLDRKAKKCFEQFMFSDMNLIGSGVLPENVCEMHLVELSGPFVLQVDEIVNISCPLKGRYQAANPGPKRCLKLSMTDGVQRVFGMEYRPIKNLEVLAPAGLKIVIRNVQVKRGILVLVPEVIEVLGGLVEDLEAARQRLVQEVNKPPRGKRTRNGVVPPLATRATHAAWPPNGSSSTGPTNDTTSQSSDPSRVVEPASGPRFSTRESTTQEFAVPNSITNLESNLSPHVGNRWANLESNLSPPVGNRRANPEPNLFSSVENCRDFFVSNLSSSGGNRRASAESNIASSVPANTTNLESNLSPHIGNRRGNLDSNLSPPAGNRRVTLEPNLSSTIENNINYCKSNLSSSGGNGRASVESTFSSTADMRASFESQLSSKSGNRILHVEANVSSIAGNSSASVEPNLSISTPDDGDIHMADQVDHSFLLSGDRELPFTYIASLSAKFAAVKDTTSGVQGRIKCFLTGVKEFHYKGVAKFELRVYVDDGSLISEILIDHNVVQEKIGHSLKEVSAAALSSDLKKKGEMKDKITQFGSFLTNFEGTMLLRMSDASPLPTAIEMCQGCSTSDAWLLLKRLKPLRANPPQQQSSIEPIELSP